MTLEKLEHLGNLNRLMLFEVSLLPSSNKKLLSVTEQCMWLFSEVYIIPSLMKHSYSDNIKYNLFHLILTESYQ